MQTTYLIKDSYPEYIFKNSNLTVRKTNNSIRKWAKDMKIHFTEEIARMVNKYMKRYPTLLVIRKMQIKATMNETWNENHKKWNMKWKSQWIKYHYKPIRRGKIVTIQNAVRMWRKWISHTLLLECKTVEPLCNTIWKFFKQTNKQKN